MGIASPLAVTSPDPGWGSPWEFCRAGAAASLLWEVLLWEFA
jgi:hypothetical protein